MIDSIIETKWLLSMEQYNQVITNQAIAIHQGSILDIDDITIINKKYTAKNLTKLPNHIVMPGLINAHCHSPMVILRSLIDDVNLQNWLQNTIWPAESALISKEFISDGMQLAIAEMLLNGTTCINEHYFLADTIKQSCRQLGMRAQIGIWLGDIENSWNTADITQNINNHKATIEDTCDLISYAWAPHSPYLLSSENLIKLAKINNTTTLPIHIHCNETATEVTDSINMHNSTPVARLHKFGLLTPKTNLVHMVHTTNEEFQLVADSKSSIISCPKSNAKLASGILPIKKVLEHNINLGLGTDSAASNNELSMLSEIRTLALNSKTYYQDPTLISAYDSLYAATLGNAKALNLEHKIGSIKIGKYADIIAVDLNRINTYPQHNPISQLVYSTNNSQITDVWVHGVHKVKQSQLTQINYNDMLSLAQRWQTKTMQFVPNY